MAMVPLVEMSIIVEVPEDLGDEEANRILAVVGERLTGWVAGAQAELRAGGYELRLRVDM